MDLAFGHQASRLTYDSQQSQPVYLLAARDGDTEARQSTTTSGSPASNNVFKVTWSKKHFFFIITFKETVFSKTEKTNIE